MDKIEKESLKNIKKLRSNEKAINYAYFHISKADIRKKILDEINKNEDEKESTPQLSSTEKRRVFNIGNSLIKGGSDFYEKLVKEIKKSEKKKFEKKIKLEKRNKAEEESVKNEKKKSKTKLALKMGLLGVVIGVSVYYFKQIYDILTKSPEIAKISKYLDKYRPVSLMFNLGSSKIIDGAISSFSIKTSSGDEISISDDKREKNPVEEAAKTFDVILTDDVLGKNGGGFNNFLNNIQAGSSAVGYLLSHPFFHFVDKIRKYTVKSLNNPALLSAGWREFYQFSLGDTLSTINSFANRQIINSYSKLKLESEDVIETKRNAFVELLRKAFEAKGYTIGDFHTSVIIDTYKKHDKTEKNTTISFKTPYGILEAIDEISDTNDPASIIRVLEMIQEENIKVGFYNTWDRYNFSNTNITLYIEKDGKKIPIPPKLVEVLGLNIVYGGDANIGDKDEKERVRQEIQNRLNNHVSNLKKIFKENEAAIIDLLAHKMYHEHFLLPKEIISNIEDGAFEKNIDAVNHALLETEIYFNKEKPTKEKIKLITDNYFLPQNNFLKGYMSIITSSFQKTFSKIMSTIGFFNMNISPYDYLLSHENFKNDDEESEKIKNLIKSHYKNRDILISESNSSGENIDLSYEVLTAKMVSFSKMKKDFREKKTNKLKDIIKEVANILIKILKKNQETGNSKRVVKSKLSVRYDKENRGLNDDYFYMNIKDEKGNLRTIYLSNLINNIKGLIGKI